jgi:hypothetical protein
MSRTKLNRLIVYCGDVDWINLAHEVVQLRDVLNNAMKFRNPQNGRKFSEQLSNY